MKTAMFSSWCASHGITTPLCILGSDPYRYVACESDLMGNILRIPLDSCLVADTPEALADRLSHERSLGSESRYAPYIDMLPTLDGSSSLRSMPRFWDPRRRETVTDGGQMEGRITRDERHGVDQWALACVASRANFLDDFRLSMTPVLDMINHDCTVGTTAKVVDSDLLLQVDRSFRAGEEVFISYGNLTNLDTLCSYGFVSHSNPCNTESMHVRIIRRPPLTFTVSPDGSIHNDALAVLRQYLASSTELLTTQEDGRPEAFVQPISDRNENEVLSFLSATLQDEAEGARLGAQEAGDDPLVAAYLGARAKLLEKGLATIQKKTKIQ